jgi:hypothetical protein
MAASRGADCPKSVVCTVVSALSGYAVPIDASPFRADRDGLSSDTFPRLGFKKPGSSSRELGSPPEFVVPTSAGFSPAPSLGSPSSSRRQSSESTLDGHPRPAYVPPAAFLALTTACSSLYLAGLFHPAAASRILAPGASSPDSAEPPRRWPVPPRRWHLQPAAGFPTTPAACAPTSRS